jgi:cytochrome oxidase Cu insertion factor (SCO1/SenC/PrrC family)
VSGGPIVRVAQVLFALVAVGVVLAFASAVRDGESRRAPEALARLLAPSYTGNNRLAPDFELADRTGRRLRLSSLRGKVVVLHFWTRTCEPCVEELQSSIPAFDEIVRDRRDIAFVMVTVDPNWDSIAPLVPNGIRAPILFDPGARVVTGRFGTRLYPETWVIDPEGVIRARFDHPLEWASPIFVNFLASLR